MIELLLAGEMLLAGGELERAEHVFAKVAEADPRNAMAVVGLARVAQARGDLPAALAFARRALAIDPEDLAARRLAGDLAAELAGGSRPAGTSPGTPRPANPPSQDVASERRPSILDRLRGLLGIRR